MFIYKAILDLQLILEISRGRVYMITNISVIFIKEFSFSSLSFD